MGAYLKTTGKIFLGLTAIGLAAGIVNRLMNPVEPDNEFSEPARILRRAAEKGNIHDFEALVDKYLPGASSADRKHLWQCAGGDSKWTTLVG